MQSVAKLRLFASPDKRRMLFATMEWYNAACNAISPVAYSERQFSNIGLQKRLYYQIRETFGLSAQMTQLAIRKVASSYRSTQEVIRKQNKILAALGKPLKSLTELSFQAHGAICYDARVLSISRNQVSIWTLEGRIKLLYTKPDHFPAVTTIKQTDLVHRGGAFWLYATVETPDGEPTKPTNLESISGWSTSPPQATERFSPATPPRRCGGVTADSGGFSRRRVQSQPRGNCERSPEESAGLRPIPTTSSASGSFARHKARSGGSPWKI